MKKIPPYENVKKYASAKTIVANLKRVAGVKRDSELAEILDISSNTIRTWQTRDIISFEPIIRICLMYDVPVQSVIYESADFSQLSSASRMRLDAYVIEKNSITKEFDFYIDSTVRDVSSITHCAIVYESDTYIVDKSESESTRISGMYFVKIDENVYLVNLQMLPSGIEMRINSTVTIVDRSEIDLLGRVVVSIVSHD